MTQIPPRGTPEFEEYKKTVEEAHRNGVKIEHAAIGFNNWDRCLIDPIWAWPFSDYRIAPDQPQPSEGVAPAPVARNGQHETFDTGAVRSSVYPKGGKFPIRLDLLFRNAAGLRRLAETWAEGNEKYGPDNWMKGFSESCIISHTLEHVRLYLAGDKSEDHLAHGAWNLLALCWVEENKPELLDLTKPNQKP